MGSYSYKYVRDLIPEYVTDRIDEYEGSSNYDGDQWIAAADYIQELEQELARQFEITKTMQNRDLFTWMTSREKTYYCDGPAIKFDPYLES